MAKEKKRKIVNLATIGKSVRCPLCHDFFERRWFSSRRAHFLACTKCKIAVAEEDPFVGRWDEYYYAPGAERIYCPVCTSEMRFFATSTGYMQARCPKDGVKIENSLPDRVPVPGAIPPPALYDKDGAPLEAPAGVDRPVATPDHQEPGQGGTLH